MDRVGVEKGVVKGMERPRKNARTIAVTALILCASLQAFPREPIAKTLKLTKEKYYNAIVTYPQFQDRTRLAREVNKTIVRWARKDQSRFINQCKKTFESLGQPIAPYEYKADYVVMHSDSARLISVKFEVHEYTGGAHGNFSFVVFNMGRVKGKVQRLMLGDFFESDTTYRKRVADLLLAKLKQDEGALFVRDGTVDSLTNDQLNLFVVQPDGLVFLFNPYDVGPWSSGAIQVKLTVEELGEGLNKKMIGIKD